MNISKILSVINCKLRYLPKKMFIYRPTYTSVSNHAEIYIEHLFAMNVSYDYKKQIFPAKLLIEENAKLKVGHFHAYNGCRIEVFSGAILEIKSGFINYNSVIECYNKISIGRNVKISENVIIRDSDGHTIIREGYNMSKPIIIEDDVWIGLNCTILKGVTIGRGSIVAAGSVVTKSVPPNSLVAGVPARVIKNNVDYR